MDTASQQILLVLEHLVKLVPIGTNLALLQLMWAMLTGRFLHSRGAVHTALHLAGFKPAAIRRSWRALRFGVWSETNFFRVLTRRYQQLRDELTAAGN